MARKRFSFFASMEFLRKDLRQAWRQILRAPAFATTVVLVLTVGFGVCIAIFSIVRHVLLSPLPYKNPDRLVQIVSRWPKSGDQNDWSAPLRDALDWKASVTGFQDVAMYHYSLFNLTEGGQAESLYGLRITANLLPMLGVRPRLGNWFSAEHNPPGNTHVIVLSYDLWSRRFHSDPEIIGKTIHLDSEGYEVAAVMPKSFNFPLKLGTSAQLPSDQMQFWMPLGVDPAKMKHGAPNDGVIARLKPGVSLSAAQTQLDGACALLQREFPETNRDLSARVSFLREQTVRQASGALVALLAAAALILLLACTNIAGLLLAKGESRANEWAVRMALGGSTWRIALLPMLQGMLLCCSGCSLGVPLAIVALRFLLYLAPIDVPRLANASIDFKAMLFAGALAIGSGILVGGLSALQVLKRSPREALSNGSRTSVGRPRTKLRSSLVVSQIALAVILISSAGLMLRTFINLLSTNIGYRASHVFYGVTLLPRSHYSQFEQRQLFFKKVLDRLRDTPGIEFAAVSTGFPLVGQYESVKAESADLAKDNRGSGISADFNAVSAGYLEAMGVRLIRGRFVALTDTANTPKVAVIDEGLARTLWPGENPLGQLINTDDPTKPVWRQVVGVVAPMRNQSLDVVARPGIFVPLDQTTGYVNFVVVKASASAQATARLLREAVSSVDTNQGVFFIQSLSDLIANTVAVRQCLFFGLAFFGAAALALSTLGIYGLITFIATSRTRELGIRMALGATRRSLVGLVVGQSIRLTLLGVGTGVLASALLGRLLSGLLFGVRTFDPETILLTIAILGSATTIAALLPAWRNTRVEPMIALRTE
jgi:putative ABC transport system permease protein